MSTKTQKRSKVRFVSRIRRRFIVDAIHHFELPLLLVIMAEVVKGSCLCEGVKFTVQGTPDAIFICYCSHCKKNAGAPGQIASLKPPSDFQDLILTISQSAKFKCENVHVLEGSEHINTWILKDNLSGCEKHKKFCSRCGCTLWTIPMKHSGSHWIVRTALLENG